MELRIPVHSRADPLLGASRGVDPICIGCKERTSNSSSLGVNSALEASTSPSNLSCDSNRGSPQSLGVARNGLQKGFRGRVM